MHVTITASVTVVATMSSHFTAVGQKEAEKLEAETQQPVQFTLIFIYIVGFFFVVPTEILSIFLSIFSDGQGVDISQRKETGPRHMSDHCGGNKENNTEDTTCEVKGED